MSVSLRTVRGCFALLRRRCREVGQPGLQHWTNLGEKAASETALLIKVAAHADEVADIEAAKEIAAGIEGLRDGRVDPVDVAHFKRAARLTKRSAEHAHDIGDVVS